MNHLLGCSKRYVKCCVPLIEVISGDSDSLRKVRDLHSYSDALFAMGAWLLFLGWFAFNAGSAPMDSLQGSQIAARAAINTLIASGAGTLFGVVFCYMLKSRLHLNTVVNSMLTSMVVITSMAGYVDLWVGLLAGPLSVLVYTFFRYLVLHVAGIDDPLDVFAVHAGGGVTGTILLGLIHPTQGLFYSGDGHLLGVQVLGCVVITAYAVVCTLLYFLVAQLVTPGGFIYSVDEQLAGLDYLFFELESQKVSQPNFSLFLSHPRP